MTFTEEDPTLTADDDDGEELPTDPSLEPREEEEETEEETPEEEVVPSDEDQPGELADDVKWDLVKRFGEKSDAELATEAFKAYQNGERVFQERADELKTYKDVAEKFGGLEALKKAIDSPNATPADPIDSYFKKLTDEGYVDPQDPKDQLLMNMAKELYGIRGNIQAQNQSSTTEKFQGKLTKDVLEKYPLANKEAIEDAVYAGKWGLNLTPEFWNNVEGYAKKMHDSISSIVDTKTTEKLNGMKELSKKSIRTGKTLNTKPGKVAPWDAFEKAFDTAFKK